MKPTKQQIEHWLERCGYEPGIHAIAFRGPNGRLRFTSASDDLYGRDWNYTPLRVFTNDGSRQIGEDFKMLSKRERVMAIIQRYTYCASALDAAKEILKELGVEDE